MSHTAAVHLIRVDGAIFINKELTDNLAITNERRMAVQRSLLELFYYHLAAYRCRRGRLVSRQNILLTLNLGNTAATVGIDRLDQNRIRQLPHRLNVTHRLRNRQSLTLRISTKHILFQQDRRCLNRIETGHAQRLRNPGAGFVRDIRHSGQNSLNIFLSDNAENGLFVRIIFDNRPGCPDMTRIAGFTTAHTNRNALFQARLQQRQRRKTRIKH